MIAVDTNLLVYSHRPEAPFHAPARGCIARLHAAGRPWAIPLHCLVEFAAVVTTPRIWQEPSTVDQVAAQVEAWRGSPTLHVLGDDATVWNHCLRLAAGAALDAGRWYDARIAATCLANRVRELWTVDRDYSRFPALPTRNPLVGEA